jgi:deoxycytidylate deaminase
VSKDTKKRSTTLRQLEDTARSLLYTNDSNRCRHFSFILYKNRLIATGMNYNKTHPLNLLNRKVSKITGEDYSEYKHTCSELNAILKLKRLTNIDTKKCTLVNIRFDRNDSVSMAKPCSSCDSLLKYHNFKQIIWSTNGGDYISI